MYDDNSGIGEAFWLAIFVNFPTFCVLITAHQLECCSLIYDNIPNDVAVLRVVSSIQSVLN